MPKSATQHSWYLTVVDQEIRAALALYPGVVFDGMRKDGETLWINAWFRYKQCIDTLPVWDDHRGSPIPYSMELPDFFRMMVKRGDEYEGELAMRAAVTEYNRAAVDNSMLWLYREECNVYHPLS